MFKKKDKSRKIVDKASHTMVSSDVAYLQSAKILKEAFKVARFNRDVEAMMLISDRWTQIARILEIETENGKMPIGFAMNSEETHE